MIGLVFILALGIAGIGDVKIGEYQLQVIVSIVDHYGEALAGGAGLWGICRRSKRYRDWDEFRKCDGDDCLVCSKRDDSRIVQRIGKICSYSRLYSRKFVYAAWLYANSVADEIFNGSIGCHSYFVFFASETESCPLEDQPQPAAIGNSFKLQILEANKEN